MLVIAGTIDIDPAKMDNALPAAKEMMAETHKEEGCVAYVFSRDVSDPGRFHLFECWQSQEALDAHMASPHMAKFQGQMGGFGVKGRDIARYKISSVDPIR